MKTQKIYKDHSLKEYTDDLGAKLAAPGGGSASALTACLGANLIRMVVNFTLGKKQYARYADDLKVILDKSEKLGKEFLRLVDLDIVAYESKDLRDALNIPFMIARLSFEGIKLCPPLIQKGNLNLISDVACAAVLLESAFTSACFNVEINLKLLQDKELSREIHKELGLKSKAIKKIRMHTEEKVGKIIGR